MYKDHLILSVTVWKRFLSRPLQLTFSERWMVIGLVLRSPLSSLCISFAGWLLLWILPVWDEMSVSSSLDCGEGREAEWERETERSQWSSLSSASRADVSSDGRFARSQLWAENILSAHSENTQPVDITSRGALNAHWYVHLRNTILEGIEKAGLWKSFPYSHYLPVQMLLCACYLISIRC